MKNLINNIQEWIRPTNRVYLKDVKIGETIWIEWNKMKTGVGQMKCIGNDPKAKKIWMEIEWGNYKVVECEQYEKKIFKYNDKALKNFNLLNQQRLNNITFLCEDSIESLQQQIQEALEKEEYELVGQLQDKLNKLSSK